MHAQNHDFCPAHSKTPEGSSRRSPNPTIDWPHLPLIPHIHTPKSRNLFSAPIFFVWKIFRLYAKVATDFNKRSPV